MSSSPWELYDAGRLTEAYHAFAEEYKQTMRPLPLANGGLVLLSMGRFEQAEGDYFKLMQLRSDSDRSFIMLGVAKWLQGKYSEAAQTWTAGKSAKYTDAAGGVELPSLLIYAGTRLKDGKLEKTGLQLLKKRWKAVGTRCWPSPLAGFHLNEVSAEELLQLAKADGPLGARQRCQACFHLAVGSMRCGDQQSAIGYLRSAVEGKEAYVEAEYYLALGELSSTSSSS